MYRGVPWVVLLRKTPTCLVLFIWGGVWGQLMGVSGSIRAAFGGTPHTYKTNPVAIWGHGSAHLTPLGG